MIDSMVDRAASILERRFLTNAFLPVVLLLPIVGLPALVQSRKIDQLVAEWSQFSIGMKAFIVVGYFTLCWFGAVILASQWRNIVRLFEGYPLWRWPWIDRVGKQWHEALSYQLGKRGRQHWYLQYSRYPPPREVLPTRLGNVLRAAERYPEQRYGAEMILIWPRLYQVLPRDAIDDVEGARSSMEFLLVLSLWFTAFTATAPVAVVLVKGAPLVAVVCFAVGSAGAYAAYLSAIVAAAEYGEQLRSIFDVYRLELLRRLNLPPVHDITEERRQWQALGALIGRRVLPTWKYGNGVAAPEDS
ncbi:hypothetical protein [Actinoplanes palleronii]|uniref:Transmembrane protein n=1 Tax=Actinoplanes palleronii TaxID=113570 RepID=A0ABQ4B502_9ACTN|nr:hypothetical protein [Actinoplanes palleronii]GIE65715.1 hypothetical protein Apa02nite_018230 [Actinoplanes palleronii]